MKIASIAGVSATTNDIAKTIAFYEGLGFRIDKPTEAGVTVLVNWFWIRFTLVDSVTPSEGVAINMKVVDIEEFYEYVRKIDLPFNHEPQNTTWNTKEFTIIDPNGHRLTFFEKI